MVFQLMTINFSCLWNRNLQNRAKMYSSFCENMWRFLWFQRSRAMWFDVPPGFFFFLHFSHDPTETQNVAQLPNPVSVHAVMMDEYYLGNPLFAITVCKDGCMKGLLETMHFGTGPPVSIQQFSFFFHCPMTPPPVWDAFFPSNSWFSAFFTPDEDHMSRAFGCDAPFPMFEYKK